jgi:small-conductance mechanosensitive channel
LARLISDLLIASVQLNNDQAMPPAITHSIELLTKSHYIVGLVVFIVWTVVSLSIKRGVFGLIRRTRRFERIKPILPPLASALDIVIATTGISFAASAAAVSPRLAGIIHVILSGGIILALIIFVDGSLRFSINRAAARFPMLSDSYGVVTAALRGLVIGLGLMMFLESIGISISPILASLGIGSLALALSLQETLKNMFSGFFIILDRPLDIGDYIKLPSGQEGWLVKLGWRSSKFRMLNDSIVVVPNSELIDTILINYRTPDGDLSLQVDLSFAGGADLGKIEQIAIEVARDVMQSVQGGVAGFKPSVYFQSATVGQVAFSVFMRVSTGGAFEPVRHEFIKRFTARCAAEGIRIP